MGNGKWIGIIGAVLLLGGIRSLLDTVLRQTDWNSSYESARVAASVGFGLVGIIFGLKFLPRLWRKPVRMDKDGRPSDRPRLY